MAAFWQLQKYSAVGFQSGILGEVSTELCISKALSEHFTQAANKFSNSLQPHFRVGLYQKFDLSWYENVTSTSPS